MAVKSTLALGLQKCVGNLWQGDDFSDFTIVVEDSSFSCHRFILGACSGFFQGLFRSQMKESLADLAKLNRMRKKTFEIIINSIYKGTDGLTEETVLDVWSATHLLQIDYLIEECKQFVIHNLSVDNCFRFLNHAMTYSAQEVIDSCLVSISKNFDQFRNAEIFLQLPLDYFYKVIDCDVLTTSSEDYVVDAILAWMEYQPDSEHCSLIYTETLHEKTADGILPVVDISTYSLTINGSQENRDNDLGNKPLVQDIDKNDQEKENDDQKNGADVKRKENIDHSAVFGIRLDEKSSMSECCEDRVKRKSNIMTPKDNKTMCSKNSARQTDSKEEDRKQHFLKLISACRLFLAKPPSLENLLENHRDLIISTGAYNMVLKALMYSVKVYLRHEAWPGAAVHRASSSYKHVMVFVSGDQFKAYGLDTGSVHEFAKMPEDCKISEKIIVFDNALYCVYQNNIKRRTFSMITKQKSWAPVTNLNIINSQMFLAHDNYIYDVHVDVDKLTLSRWSYTHGHSKWMTQTCARMITGHFLVRFQLHIVIFIKENRVITAYCFNTKTDNVHVCKPSMDAFSLSMISFSRNDDVYILEGNGSLWKVVSTDTAPVDFEMVSKLWNFNCTLKGCVLYRNKLYIFHDSTNSSTIFMQKKNDYKALLTSLPGICEDIEMIKIDSTSLCLPMVLPGSWFTS